MTRLLSLLAAGVFSLAVWALLVFALVGCGHDAGDIWIGIREMERAR